MLHTEPVVICVFMRYPWKTAKKSSISYHLWRMSPMQPVIKGIWLGDSFTSALETWPTVSLLQTTFFIDCCFLTFVLLPCFSASPINCLSDHRSPPITTQMSKSFLYGQIWQEQNSKGLYLLLWKQTLLFTHKLESKDIFKGRGVSVGRYERMKTEMLSHNLVSFQPVSRAVLKKSVLWDKVQKCREKCWFGHRQLNIYKHCTHRE